MLIRHFVLRRWSMLGLISLLLLTVGGSAHAAGPATLPDFTELVGRNASAVVNISLARTSSGRPAAIHRSEMDAVDEARPDALFSEEGPDGPDVIDGRSLGSGFIVSPDGYVVTNFHVVKGVAQVVVRLSDRRELQARLIGGDDGSDIALLKVQSSSLPVLKTGLSSDLKPGEWVLAMGSPFGFDHSVTAGIVSGKGRTLPGESQVSFIQTDVAINPGNSGGPLFNLKGEVVGINSQIYSRTGGFMGLSFAIPIEEAMSVVEQLKTRGRVSRGWLGVYVQQISADLGKSLGTSSSGGALIAKLSKGGPAERGGLKVGDVILRFDGKEIDESHALPFVVSHTAVGKRVTLDLVRNGKRLRQNLVVAELPVTTLPGARHGGKRSKASVQNLQLADLSPEERLRLGLKVGGVRIMKLSEGGIEGLHDQDVLVMADGIPLETGQQVRELIQKSPGNRPISLLVKRGGDAQFVPLGVSRQVMDAP